LVFPASYKTLKYGLDTDPASTRGSVKVSGKKFFTTKIQLKEKSFCQEPEGLDLDCGWAEAIFV
jgi:hypothetical protein